MTEVAPPFVITFGFEGEGTLDAAAWREAGARVAALHPGARMRLAGTLGRTRWVSDGAPPRVLELDGTSWTGAGPEGAAFLDAPFDLKRGPVIELILLQGPRPRVILRAPHAALDGKAALLFLAEVFAALRGDPLAGPTEHGLTDGDVARALAQKAEQPPGMDHLAVTGAIVGDSIASVWRRRRVNGAPSRLLPRMGLELARHARAASGANGAGLKIRVDFPVDLRRHRGDIRSLGNLSGLLRVPIEPETATVDAIQAHMRRALDAREEARAVLLAEGVRSLPLWLMRAFARGTAKKMRARGRFDTTATVSNLGRLDLPRLQGGGFRVVRSWAIGPISPALPLFLTAIGDEDGVELCGTMPVALASEGRLEAVLDALVVELERG